MALAKPSAHAELSQLLDQLQSDGGLGEALGMICSRFSKELVLLSSLQLGEARRIAREVIGASGTAALTDLQTLIDGLCTLSMHDGLTGLFNRRHFDEQLGIELRRATRNMAPCCVILGDVDAFKKVNDEHGHNVGDCVLQMVARKFEASVRLTDIVVRYGGEEFAAIVPSTPAVGAIAVAERIRNAVAQSPVELDGKRLLVTLSLGVSGFAPGDEIAPDELVGRADGELYRAKRNGKNRVCCAPEDLARLKPSGISANERELLLP